MQIKGSNNLCSTYILPLIGFKYDDFGEANFISSYIDETDTYIVVELKFGLGGIQVHPQFRFEFNKDEKTYCVFEVPLKFRDSLIKFREGKYSEFSEDAKNTIRVKSGWMYKVKKPGGKVVSSRELLALYKDQELREIMEKALEVKIDRNAELASIPGDDNFFRLNLSKSVHS